MAARGELVEARRRAEDAEASVRELQAMVMGELGAARGWVVFWGSFSTRRLLLLLLGWVFMRLKKETRNLNTCWRSGYCCV